MDRTETLERFRGLMRDDLARGEAKSLSAYLRVFGNEFAGDLAQEYESTLAAAKADAPKVGGESIAPIGVPLAEKGEIARGGMGAILRVRDGALRRDLAMKVALNGRGTGSQGWVARFVDEAQIQAQLDHPGVVPIHHLGTDASGRLCFTMKLVRGRSLSQVLADVREGREKPNLTKFVQALLRVCETMAYAHGKGVIHRDLKPANVMIGDFGEVYVMDWGVAKVLGEPERSATPITSAIDLLRTTPQDGTESRSGLTEAGSVLGTPAYMPPEQARGTNEELDERGDVYSIGAILYEALAGRAPYEDPAGPRRGMELLRAVMAGPPTPLAKVAPRAPDELVAIAEKAMSRERAGRYPSARELADDLQAWIEGRVVRAHRRGVWPTLSKWVARNRALSSTIAVALIVVAVLATRYALLEREAKVEIARERDNALLAAEVARKATVREGGLRLATIATMLADKDPTLTSLLALEGYDRAPGRESRTALYAAAVGLSETLALGGHDGYVRGGVWSADGRRIYTAAEDGFVRMWDANTGELLKRVNAHSESILGIESRGGRLLTRGKDGAARVWDMDTMERVCEILPGAKLMHFATFSPDGSRVATCGSDGIVRVFDAATARELTRMGGDHGPVGSLAWSPDGKRLAAGGADFVVRVWEVEDAKQRYEVVCRDAPTPPAVVADERTLREHVPLVEWSPDGARLVTWAVSPALEQDRGAATGRVWDAADGRRLGAGAPAWRDFLTFTADGRDAVVVSPLPGEGNRCALASLADGSVRDAPWRALLRGGFERARVSPDGRLAVFVEPNFKVGVFSTAKPMRLLTFTGHRYTVADLAFSPDGARLLTCSHDLTARVWDVSPTHVLRGASFLPGEKGVCSLEARGAWIGVVRRPAADANALFEFVDARTGDVVFAGPRGDANLFNSSPDGRRAFVATGEAVEAWDVAKRERLAHWEAPGCNGSFVDPAGRRVATRSDKMNPGRPGGHLYVFDLDHPDGPPLFLENPDTSPDGHLHEVAWSADGKLIAAAHGYSGPVVWNATTGELVHHFVGHTGMCLVVAFSPDGEHLASQGMDASVRIWGLAPPYEETARCTGLAMARAAISFSADGRLLAAASTLSDAVRVFDAKTGEEWAKIPNGGASYCDVRAIGDEFVTLQTDGVARVFPLDPAAWIRARLPRRLTLAEADGYGVGDETERLDREIQVVTRRPAPADVSALVRRLVETGRVEDAKRMVLVAEKNFPDDWRTFLSQARLAARAGDVESAFDLLRRADARGLERRRLVDDPGFVSLHGDPRWAALLAAR